MTGRAILLDPQVMFVPDSTAQDTVDWPEWRLYAELANGSSRLDITGIGVFNIECCNTSCVYIRRETPEHIAAVFDFKAIAAARKVLDVVPKLVDMNETPPWPMVQMDRLQRLLNGVAGDYPWGNELRNGDRDMR